MLKNPGKTSATFVAFLRGINVGGNHKVPMAELKTCFVNLGFTDIFTLLNSGNIVFKARPKAVEFLEEQLESFLSNHYNFQIPVLIRTEEQMIKMLDAKPFEAITSSKDIQQYVTFTKEITNKIELPHISEDQSFQILYIEDNAIFSTVDSSITQSKVAMLFLEKNFGKTCTTRNWNTLIKVRSLFK